MRVLGLDVGEKRIGVAKADSSTRIAIPIGYINVDGSEWQEIAKLARINSTNLFVLGLPRSNSGNETAQSLYVRNFAKVMTEKIPGARIKFQDESLTSVVAEERLKQRNKGYEKGEIDAEAASIILQDFMEGLSNTSSLQEKNSSESSSQEVSGVHGMVNGMRSAVLDAGETVSSLTKKEADKVKLNTKKVKHRMKTATKLITGLIILVVIGLLATGGVLWYKDIKAKERAEEYARQEAAMTASTFDFTIRPGETIYDIKKHLLELDRNTNPESEEKLANYTETEIDSAFKAQYNYSFLKNRPERATLEGFLYPETHNFYSDSTVSEILEVFLSEMDKVVKENDLEKRYSNLGLSLFEGITLASIVQKEASPPDQPTVAQVFLSRLSNGMLLGSDVTVSYALDTVDPSRTIYTDNMAALQVDSCYNTRIYSGLPCGPIANPGLSALLAVAEPSDTAYLYFLTGDDGMMYYGYTESEHNQNIYSHCQKLCNVSL